MKKRFILLVPALLLSLTGCDISFLDSFLNNLTSFESSTSESYQHSVGDESSTPNSEFNSSIESLFESSNKDESIALISSESEFSEESSIGEISTEINYYQAQFSYNQNDLTKYNLYNIDSCPTMGDVNFLVIPVWFTDSSKYIVNKNNVRNDIESAFFGENEDVGWRSVKGYYDELSQGLVNIDGVVTDWYECNLSSSTFYSEDTAHNNIVKMLKKAINWYKLDCGDSTLSSFDADSDGYLDNVVLVYGAPDYGAMFNDNYNMWAYVDWVQETNSNRLSPAPNAFLWASYDFMYSRSQALIRAGTKYGSGDTLHCNIDTHTFIHETGHIFGLEDYYDYSNTYDPAGSFSMQDFNVGSHDPYSVMTLGWADPLIPEDDCTITIRDFQSSHDLILLTPEMNNDYSPFDEYLLLELYTTTGLNEFDHRYAYNGYYSTGAAISGIRLWHVDARLVQYSYSAKNGGYKYSFTDPTIGNVLYMMSNTYYSSQYDLEGYISPLGVNFSNYNLLQLIRYDKTLTYLPKTSLNNHSLFTTGATFSMQDYKKQFVNGIRLNNDKELGWEFTVDSIVDNTATISLRRI